MTDKDLIQQLQQGKEQAFEYLVDHYQELVGNTCYGFVQNQTEAEELAQDVFVEVFLSIKKFRGEAKLSTWLYRIAVNKGLNAVNKKKQKRRLQTVSTFFGFGEEKERDFADDKQMGVLKQMEAMETKKALERAIEKLPDKQRSAFVLRKYEELSYVEIAKVLETTVSSVESLIHRASRNLRKYLEDFYYNYYQK